MILCKGDMFAAHCHVLLVTANISLRNNGTLVMGRGAALQLAQKYPGIDAAFGRLIKQHVVTTGIDWGYGVLAFRPNTQSACSVGIFQVKHHWAEAAKIELITASVDVLRRYALQDWAKKKIHLNFPGIGNGGLRRKHVLPLLERLPDNVKVWEYI